MLITIAILSMLYGSNISAQNQNRQAEAAYEVAKEQVESAQRSEFNQSKRDYILGHSSKNDFDNIFIFFGVFIVGYISWKIIIGRKEDKDSEERIRHHLENNGHSDEYYEEIETEKIKNLLRLMGQKSIFIKFIDDECFDFNVFASFFDENINVSRKYGILSDKINSTADRDDIDYFNIWNSWREDNKNNRNSQNRVLLLNLTEIPSCIKYVPIYFSYRDRSSCYHHNVTIGVQLDGMESENKNFLYKIESLESDVLINIGYLERISDSKWIFEKTTVEVINIGVLQFSEKPKDEILGIFENSFRDKLKVEKEI